jgi:hypothetical protein
MREVTRRSREVKRRRWRRERRIVSLRMSD